MLFRSTFLVTSNAWDSIDPAMRRPGRFVEIPFKPLTEGDIRKCFGVHLNNLSRKLARSLSTFSVDLDEPFTFLSGNLPKELTGADVKECLDRILAEKALKFLDRRTKDSQAELCDEDLISEEDVMTAVYEIGEKYTKNRRSVGFQ